MNKQKPKNRFRLTPEIYKSIKVLIATLPVCQRRDKKGELMWRYATKYVGAENFDPVKKTYTKRTQTGRKPILVNHEVNMVDIFQKEGQNGLDTYVKFFLNLKKEWDEKKEKAPEVVSE